MQCRMAQKAVDKRIFDRLRDEDGARKRGGEPCRLIVDRIRSDAEEEMEALRDAGKGGKAGMVRANGRGVRESRRHGRSEAEPAGGRQGQTHEERTGKLGRCREEEESWGREGEEQSRGWRFHGDGEEEG